MHSIRKASCLAVLSLTMLGLPSCVVSGGFESVAPAGDFYVYGGSRYYYPPAYPGYARRTTVYTHYYGGRYYSYPWWNDARYRQYRHVRQDHVRQEHRAAPRRDPRDARPERRDWQRRHDDRRGDRDGRYERRR